MKEKLLTLIWLLLLPFVVSKASAKMNGITDIPDSIPIHIVHERDGMPEIETRNVPSVEVKKYGKSTIPLEEGIKVTSKNNLTQTIGTEIKPFGTNAITTAIEGLDSSGEEGSDTTLKDGDIFTAQTAEGVEMTFKVISASEKTCQVGKGLYSSDICINANTSGTITIPRTIQGLTVTAIGRCAFYECRKLTSVTIPNSVTSIGRDAFYRCSTLTAINLPQGLISVDDRAFFSCSSAKSLTLPSTLRSIGHQAFDFLYGLSSIHLPASVSEFKGIAFAGCTNVTTITVDAANPYFDSRNNCNAIVETGSNTLISSCRTTIIPSSVTTIGSHAFWYNSTISSITIPKGVKSISSYAFDNCSSLSSISVEGGNSVYDSRDNCNAIIESHSNTLIVGSYATIIPTSVTGIGDYAFSGRSNTNFTSINIPLGLKTIGRYAFDYCYYLNTINIPSTVTHILDNAFYYCSNLSSVNLSEGIRSIGQSVFENCKYLKSLNLPTTMLSIGSYTFRGCSALTSIMIPRNVEEIGNQLVANCPNLTTIKVDTQNPYFDSRDNCNAIVQTATNKLIAGCKSSTIPNTVNVLGSYCFAGCTDLTSITLPNRLSTIEYDVFLNCTNLKTVKCMGSFPPVISYSLLPSYAETTLYVPKGMKSTYASANIWSNFTNIQEMSNVAAESFDIKPYDEFEEEGISYQVNYDWNTVTVTGTTSNFNGGDLTIPATVKNGQLRVRAIGSNAFSNNKLLKSVTISTGIISIEANAFSSCSLTSVIIPSSVTSIGSDAFNYCHSLQALTLPEGVQSVGFSAFWNCNGLKSITIPKSLIMIDRNAFNACYDLQTITIASGNPVYDSRNDCDAIIETNTNKLLTGTVNTVIPESVESIGECAFISSAMNSLKIPSSVKSIDDDAFRCSNMKTIVVDERNQYLNSFDNCNAIIETATNTILYGCINTVLPKSVIKIGAYAFMDCRWTEYTIPEGIIDIGNSAFWCNRQLTSISLPSTLYNITGQNIFSQCDKLKTVICHSLTPPVSSQYGVGFPNNGKDMTLYVPKNTKEAYEKADLWKDFGNIIEMDDLQSEAYAVLSTDQTTLSLYYDGNKDSRQGTIYEIGKWKVNSYYLTSIIIDPSFADYTEVTSTSRWFSNLNRVSMIQGLEYLKTDNVTDMSQMFYSCNALTSLDVSHFNTTNVKNMDYMFCQCREIKNLDISNFNTSNVMSMQSMFAACSGLTNLDVSKLDISNATNIAGMFSGCTGLTYLDLSNFNTAKLQSINFLVSGCSYLEKINLQNFDTSNIGGMSCVFSGCSNLSSLDLSSFNTSKVTDMSGMFSGCTGLTDLDLTMFDTSNTLYMGQEKGGYGMFQNCTNLRTIYIGNQWKTDQLICSYEMFAGCTSLVGGDGTKFDSNYTDATKAYAGPGGYLTMEGQEENYAYIDGIYYNLSGNNAEVVRGENDYSGVVVIPASVKYKDKTYNVTSIKERAFYGCSNLTSIMILSGDSLIYKKDYIENGDFSSGNEGFSSDYRYVNETGSYALWDEGTYSIGTSPSYYHGNFIAHGDHTSGTGNMLIVNGSSNNQDYVWKQYVTVEKGKTYEFSAWFIAVVSYSTFKEDIEYSIDGSVILGAYDKSENDWDRYYGRYTATKSGEIEIKIRTRSEATGGNDFAIDDISFSALSAYNSGSSNAMSIGYEAFYGCSSLTSITIGSGVTNISGYAFKGCSNLTDVYCYAEKVPVTQSNAFEKSPIASATLHVPASSIDSYKATKPWSDFGNIVAIGEDEGDHDFDWSIGPGGDFADVNAAMSDTRVKDGDVLQVLKGAGISSTSYVTKAVTIVGNGYEDKSDGYVSGIYIDSDDVTLKNLYTSYIYVRANNATIERCRTGSISGAENYESDDVTIRGCFVLGTVHSYYNNIAYGWTVSNNIILASNVWGNILDYLEEATVDHNLIINYFNDNVTGLYAVGAVKHSSFTNNIFIRQMFSQGISPDATGSATKFEYNIVSNTGTFANWPTNITGYSDLEKLFVCTGDRMTDAYYKLAAGSPAIGYANDGGDCGPWSGAFPYVLNGKEESTQPIDPTHWKLDPKLTTDPEHYEFATLDALVKFLLNNMPEKSVTVSVADTTYTMDVIPQDLITGTYNNDVDVLLKELNGYMYELRDKAVYLAKWYDNKNITISMEASQEATFIFYLQYSQTVEYIQKLMAAKVQEMLAQGMSQDEANQRIAEWQAYLKPMIEDIQNTMAMLVSHIKTTNITIFIDPKPVDPTHWKLDPKLTTDPERYEFATLDALVKFLLNNMPEKSVTVSVADATYTMDVVPDLSANWNDVEILINVLRERMADLKTKVHWMSDYYSYYNITFSMEAPQMAIFQFNVQYSQTVADIQKLMEGKAQDMLAQGMSQEEVKNKQAEWEKELAELMVDCQSTIQMLVSHIKTTNISILIDSELIRNYNGDIEPNDLLALKNIYNLLGGSNWTNKKWKFNDYGYAKEDFPGVTFDDEGYVVQIELPNNNLRGSINTSWKWQLGLPRLTGLYLQKNNISGDLSPWLRSSRSLRALDMSYNNITEISDTIPSSITSLFLGNQNREWYRPDGVTTDPLKIEAMADLQPIRLYLSSMQTVVVPSLFTYNHASQTHSARPTIYIINAEGIDKYGYFYSSNQDSYSLAWKDGEYAEKQNAPVYVRFDNPYGSVYPAYIRYIEGDANMSGYTDVLDVQTTLNYVLTDGGVWQFNRSAANTYEDNLINVQDIVCMVNIVLNNEAVEDGIILNQSNSRRLSRAADAPDVQGWLYTEQGRVMLTSANEMGTLDLELKGVSTSQVSLLLNHSQYQMIGRDTEQGSRYVIFSPTGQPIPASEEVALLAVSSQTELLAAQAADMDAQELALAIGQPTGMAQVLSGAFNATFQGDELVVTISKDIQDMSLNLFTTGGQVVLQKEESGVTRGELRMQAPVMPGAYILEMTTREGGRKIVKLMKR